MAFLYKRLTEITTITGSVSVMFNNSTASTTSYIRSIILHNNHTASVIVKLYNVPNSGAAPGAGAAGNQFFYATMTAGQTIMIEVPIPGLVLSDQYDTIQAWSDNASKVTIQIFGGQETA